MIKTWAIRRLYFPADDMGGGGGAGGSASEGNAEGGAPSNSEGGGEEATPPPDNKDGQTENKGKTESNPWDFDAEATPEEESSEDNKDGQQENKEGNAEGGEAVKIELPESLNVPAEYQDMLSEVAKEAGLTSAQAQKFVEAALTRDRQMMQELYLKQDKALREEWGVDYASRCKTAVAFAQKLAKMCNLTNDDMSAWKSPVGLRSLYRMSRQFAEGRMGGKVASPAMTPRQQMQDMLHNPDNPHHRGLIDNNAPLSARRAAAEEYNRLAGFHIVPVP